MSSIDLMQDLLCDARDRARRAEDRAFGFQQQLIKRTAAYRSLVAHLRMAADDLEKSSPRMAARYREVLQSWETFCAEPQTEMGEVASSTAGGSADEKGSGAVSEAATQLESTEGLPVLDGPATVSTVMWEGMEFPELPSLCRKQAE